MTTKTAHAKIKRTKRLTLKDRLSRLTYVRACQLLGPDGAELIRQGAAYRRSTSTATSICAATCSG